MADDDQPQPQGAPSAPPMVAPVAPATPKRRRRRKAGAGSGNGAPPPRKGGRRKLTDDEKAAAAAAREQAERERAEAQTRGNEARRGMARLAAIGALTPDLLSTDEIAGLAKFVLAMMQQAPAEAQA